MLIIIPVFITIYGGVTEIKDVALIFVLPLIGCLPIIIPTLRLHFKHYKFSNGKRLRFSEPDKIIVSFPKENKTESIEVKKVVQYIRNPKADEFITFLFWTDYYYVKVISKCNKQYVFSCLLFEPIKENFQISQEYVYIPDISKHDDPFFKPRVPFKLPAKDILEKDRNDNNENKTRTSKRN